MKNKKKIILIVAALIVVLLLPDIIKMSVKAHKDKAQNAVSLPDSVQEMSLDSEADDSMDGNLTEPFGENADEEKNSSQEKKSGVHYVEKLAGATSDKLVTSYDEIPDSVREEMKECALASVKKLIEENPGDYWDIGELKYEGYAFWFETNKSDPNENEVRYFFSTTGSRTYPFIEGEIKSGAICFYSWVDYVVKADDNTFGSAEMRAHCYSNNREEYEFDLERLMTTVYTHYGEPYVSSLTVETGDGFEKYGNYTYPTTVEQVENDPFFEFMKERGKENIDYYMDHNFEENIHYTEPEFYGLGITKEDDENSCKVFLFYKSVISDTEGLCEDTEIYFCAPFYQSRITQNGELTYYYSDKDLLGKKLELGNSAYFIRAFPDIASINEYLTTKKHVICEDMSDSLR